MFLFLKESDYFAEERDQRQLTNVLATEVVNNRRLMGDDEEGTIAVCIIHSKEPIEPRLSESALKSGSRHRACCVDRADG